jgi:hypothetical protein
VIDDFGFDGVLCICGLLYWHKPAALFDGCMRICGEWVEL